MKPDVSKKHNIHLLNAKLKEMKEILYALQDPNVDVTYHQRRLTTLLYDHL